MPTKFYYLVAAFVLTAAQGFGSTEEFLKSLNPTKVFDDGKGAGLVVFPYSGQLQTNTIFLGQSKGAFVELTQLRIIGGLDGPQGSAGAKFSRDFKTAQGASGTLFFSEEGIYVLSEGKTNFFQSKPEQIPLFSAGLKAGQVKLNLLPPTRHGTYVFYVKTDDLYFVIDSPQDGATGFEVFAGKRGALNFVGAARSDQARNGSGTIFVEKVGTFEVPNMFEREGQLVKPDGQRVKFEILAQGSSSEQKAVEIGISSSRYTGESTPLAVCKALLGL